MPTILLHNGYRYFFYSNDHAPLHIHIEKGGRTAKFNLEPIELVRSSKFNANELKEIRNFITQNTEFLKSEWDGFFNNN